MVVPHEVAENCHEDGVPVLSGTRGHDAAAFAGKLPIGPAPVHYSVLGSHFSAQQNRRHVGINYRATMSTIIISRMDVVDCNAT